MREINRRKGKLLTAIGEREEMFREAEQKDEVFLFKIGFRVLFVCLYVCKIFGQRVVLGHFK